MRRENFHFSPSNKRLNSPWKAQFQGLENINKVLKLLTRGGLRFPWRILHKQHANVHCNNDSLSSFCFSFPQIGIEFLLYVCNIIVFMWHDAMHLLLTAFTRSLNRDCHFYCCKIFF